MIEKLEKEYGGRWKEIEGFPGYYVSDFGEVYGVSKGRLMNKYDTDGRVIRVDVRRCSGEYKTKRVARLVAQAFVPNPEKKPIVFHKDNNSANNNADNLMWVTFKELHNFMIELGLREDAYPEETKNEARELYKTGEYTQKELAEKFGVSKQAIRAWVKGVKKKRIDPHREDRKKACELYATGKYKQYELAEMFGVARRTISDWICKAGLSSRTVKIKPKHYSTEVPAVLKKCENEEWKWIDGYPGYFISDCGRVYSEKSDKFLKKILRGEYLSVNLSNNGKVKSHDIHRLVAEVFIPNSDPENKTDINHINGDKHDNRAANLEWVTKKENIQHAGDTGLNPTLHTSELRKKVVEHQKRENCTLKKLSELYNVSVNTISRWVREEAEKQSDQNKTTEQEA